MARRDAERHLLAIGAEFERALVSYAGGARGPRTLDELVRDPRMPGTRRHLRQIYADPLTGRPDWGLVTDPQGFIVGVYSLAEGRPIQRSAFEAHWGHMEEADSYRDWVFGVRAGAGGVRR